MGALFVSQVPRLGPGPLLFRGGPSWLWYFSHLWVTTWEMGIGWVQTSLSLCPSYQSQCFFSFICEVVKYLLFLETAAFVVVVLGSMLRAEFRLFLLHNLEPEARRLAPECQCSSLNCHSWQWWVGSLWWWVWLTSFYSAFQEKLSKGKINQWVKC